MDESFLPEGMVVAETIADAAAQIRKHSFALYRVEASTACKLRAAHRTAAGFFRETIRAPANGVVNANSTQEAFVEHYRRVQKGNLYGYNRPLPSKDLFRTWLEPSSNDATDNSAADERELDGFRNQQPWPSKELCLASFHLAKDLHEVLSECVGQIVRFSDPNLCTRSGNGANDDENATDSNPTRDISRDNHDQRRQFAPSSSPPRKRHRVALDASSKNVDGDGDNRMSIDGNDRGDEKLNRLPLSVRPRACPLDFFFYHNRIPHAINCSEHVDRGALVVVCLTDVPGLEVRSSHTGKFFCPEAGIHNASLYRERTEDTGCPGVVCILAGNQLSQLLTTKPPTIRACVHRVRNPLKRARLSISYELRLEDVETNEK
jgi:hypothetical protein